MGAPPVPAEPRVARKPTEPAAVPDEMIETLVSTLQRAETQAQAKRKPMVSDRRSLRTINRAEMRRAIILSELLRPPLALRDPEDGGVC